MIPTNSEMASVGPLTVLIADDEPISLEILRDFVVGDPRLELIGEAASGPEALHRIEENRPDLAFLDIRMPGLSMLEALRSLSGTVETLPLVVFATAYENYAVQAFDVQVVDFLLKPFGGARFAESVRRACYLYALASSTRCVGPSVELAEDSQTFFIKRRGLFESVPSSEILLFKTEGRWVMACTVDGKEFVLQRSLASLHRDLGDSFIRANRTVLANRTQIRGFHRIDERRLALEMTGGLIVEASKLKTRWIRRNLLRGRTGR